MKVPIDIGRHILSFCDQPTLDRTTLVSRALHRQTQEVRIQDVLEKARQRHHTKVTWPLPSELAAQNCVQPRSAAIVATMTAFHRGPNGQPHPGSPTMESYYAARAAFDMQRSELQAALQAPVSDELRNSAAYFTRFPFEGQRFTGWLDSATGHGHGLVVTEDNIPVFDGSFRALRPHGVCTVYRQSEVEQAFYSKGHAVRFVSKYDTATQRLVQKSFNHQNKIDFMVRLDPATGCHYQGQVRKRLPHGFGVRRMGDTYVEGTFVRGRLRRGLVIFPGGDTLESSFCRFAGVDRPWGHCAYTWAQTGTRFEGTVDPRSDSAPGTLTFADGSTVRGTFRLEGSPTGGLQEPVAAMAVSLETAVSSVPPGSMAARFLRP